jgi:hypothetical protein
VQNSDKSVELAIRALRLGEIEKFLRGQMPYDWKSRLSPSDAANDITEAWSGIRRAAIDRGIVLDSAVLQQAVARLIVDIDGIDITVGILMCESRARRDDELPLQIDLNDLASQLKSAVISHWEELKAAKPAWALFPDGMLEVMRRSSIICSSRGYPFFPDPS